MLGNRRLVAQQRERLIGPVTVEEGLLQGGEILTRHLVLAVDEVGLCQPLVAAAAFLEVEDRLLRLKHRALGDVDHAQLVEGLCGGQGTGGVFLDVGQQTRDAVLVVVEQLIQQHAVHRQGEILHRHTDLVVGLLPVGGLQDAVPLLVTRHEVILHHLLRSEIGVLPDKRAHDDGNKSKRASSHDKVLRRADPLSGNTSQKRNDKCRQPCRIEQPGRYRRVAIVMAASP